MVKNLAAVDEAEHVLCCASMGIRAAAKTSSAPIFEFEIAIDIVSTLMLLKGSTGQTHLLLRRARRLFDFGCKKTSSFCGLFHGGIGLTTFESTSVESAMVSRLKVQREVVLMEN